MKVRFARLPVPVVLLAIGLITGTAYARLVALWTLDKLNDNIVYDSINGYEGSLKGDTTLVAGKGGGGALQFDGDGDYVDCGGGKNENEPNTWADITEAITVAAWIKGPLVYKPQTIIAKGDTAWRLYFFGSNWFHFHCTGLDAPGNPDPNDPVTGIREYVAVSDGQWHHVAGVYDGAKLYLYLDGVLKASRDTIGRLNTNNQPVYIGKNSEESGRDWKGFLDEVAIFDHGLCQDEIAQLYRMGVTWLNSDPTLLKLLRSVGTAEAIMKEQNPKEAVAFLEKQIAEYEQWSQGKPNDTAFCHRMLASDLYFLLAKAKGAASAPQKQVTEAYRCVIQSGAPSTLSYQSALIWLCENGNTKHYEDIIGTLIQNNIGYLETVATKSEMMLCEQQPKAALTFLEDNLAAYKHWRKKHPYDDVIANDHLPRIYFQLAKIREAVGAPKEDIADAYSKTFIPSRFNYAQERDTSLIWLIENEFNNAYTRIIRTFTGGVDIENSVRKTVISICNYFESKKNWAAFECFLDALFADIKHPLSWTELVESSLGDKANQWGQAYFDYLDSKPRSKFGWDWAAEKYTANNNFEEAIQRYRDIIENYDTSRNKVVFELRLCECLFYAGKYEEASSRLENFITNYKSSHGNLTKEAMLILGRTYVKLGELDKAIEAFFNLTMDYPEAKDMPEVNFFVGYCYMLQSKFNAAVEVFDCLINDHPNSPYSGRARMCITRIKSMTE